MEVERCAPRQEDVLIHSRALNGLASVCFRPNWQDTGKDFIVICHKGTHTTWQWLLDAQALYYPLWESDNRTPGSEALPPCASSSSTAAADPELNISMTFTDTWQYNGLFDQDYGFVHMGFLMYWLSTRVQVRDAVGTFLKTDKCKSPIILVTGHSLGSGAAIAGLLDVHRDVKNMMQDRKLTGDMHVVLSGAPRGGTQKYNQQILKLKTDSVLKLAEFTRYVYEQDLVRTIYLARLDFVQAQVHGMRNLTMRQAVAYEH